MLKINIEKIKIIMANKGFTLEALAKACNLSRSGIYKLMRKGSAQPVTVGKIANALDVKAEDIVVTEG